MSDVEQQIQARLTWVRLYASTQDAGLVCRRCGISRPTLRKWWRRFQAQGEEGLHEHSRRPRKTPAPKVTPQYEELILKLRRERNLGAIEFYPTADLKDAELALRLEEWQFDYNWHRPHSSLSGKTPGERCCELTEQTPMHEVVADGYDSEGRG